MLQYEYVDVIRVSLLRFDFLKLLTVQGAKEILVNIAWMAIRKKILRQLTFTNQ